MTETERRLEKPDDGDLHDCLLCGAKTCTVADAACDACMFTVELSLAS